VSRVGQKLVKFKEERQLYSGIERMYMLDREQRTISNFAEIIVELKEQLHKWMQAGQYGFVFDNVEDTLTFSRFQTFNVDGWNGARTTSLLRFPSGQQ